MQKPNTKNTNSSRSTPIGIAISQMTKLNKNATLARFTTVRRRSESAQKKNQLPITLLYSALIKKFVCKIESFAFDGNSLHCQHDDCIFVLPLRLSVNHYYKQVINAQSQ